MRRQETITTSPTGPQNVGTSGSLGRCWEPVRYLRYLVEPTTTEGCPGGNPAVGSGWDVLGCIAACQTHGAACPFCALSLCPLSVSRQGVRAPRVATVLIPVPRGTRPERAQWRVGKAALLPPGYCTSGCHQRRRARLGRCRASGCPQHRAETERAGGGWQRGDSGLRAPAAKPHLRPGPAGDARPGPTPLSPAVSGACSGRRAPRTVRTARSHRTSSRIPAPSGTHRAAHPGASWQPWRSRGGRGRRRRWRRRRRRRRRKARSSEPRSFDVAGLRLPGSGCRHVEHNVTAHRRPPFTPAHTHPPHGQREARRTPLPHPPPLAMGPSAAPQAR